MLLFFFQLLSILLVVVVNASSSSSSSSFHPNAAAIIGKLTADNRGMEHAFGYAVAISNNRIVVGAQGYNHVTGAAAYVFGDPNEPKTGHSYYSQWAILSASSDDSSYTDWYGCSVDIDGDTIVVGAPSNSDDGLTGGAVYVYRVIFKDDNGIITISQVAKLTAASSNDDDSFGSSVAVHGKHILVGAPVLYGFGSAFLFEENRSTNDLHHAPAWTQLQRFQSAKDGTNTETFGISVALEDDMAVIGSCDNAAYVVEPTVVVSSSIVWTQTTKLTFSDGTFVCPCPVAMSKNSILIGHWSEMDDTDKMGNNGAVIVFSKSSTSSWTQTARLTANDAAEEDYFGISVAISDDASTIVVGAKGVDWNTTIKNSGAAYMFRMTDATTSERQWTQVGKFMAPDTKGMDEFGTSLAVASNMVVVGDPGDDSGSVYILDVTTIASTAEPTANSHSRTISQS
jgi:hypothetical protein